MRGFTLEDHVASVVALGNDTDEGTILNDRQSSDIALGHFFDGVKDSVGRVGGPDCGALIGEDG